MALSEATLTELRLLLKSRYWGALLFNCASFTLPAVYGTLSKMWIAGVDALSVATLDSYTYASTAIEPFNEGLPRAAWVVDASTITNYSTYTLHERLSLVNTLILVQTLTGLVVSTIFVSIAPNFVGSFVPGPVRATSVKYVRVSSFGMLASLVETAVSIGTRSLDKPDVPLAISSVKTLLNIFLDLALISKVRVGGFEPTVVTQATIRLVCDLTGAAVGLLYYLYLSRKLTRESNETKSTRPSWRSFLILFFPGLSTFAESAVRNAIYLYLIHSVVSLGSVYATAYGVLMTIRWGLVMVPVYALEATSNAFVGHRWGIYKERRLAEGRVGQRGSWKDVRFVAFPALRSAAIALAVEVPLLLIMTFAAVKPFAFYLSGSEEVAVVTQKMWRTIDWCYICYAVSTQLATVLLATRPVWYLLQSLLANLSYSLPWAIALSKIAIDEDSAWFFHAFVFGESMVESLIIILVVTGVWAWRLRAGRMA
ncbi:hypothetical protein BDY24DRAFT_408114 [Mrakia frigida]|uniref:uncharacterized protein n=1 Tax=Mrakia frigida TaxID=29902 RepID=UPI003FCC1CE8